MKKEIHHYALNSIIVGGIGKVSCKWYYTSYIYTTDSHKFTVFIARVEISQSAFWMFWKQTIFTLAAMLKVLKARSFKLLWK